MTESAEPQTFEADYCQLQAAHFSDMAEQSATPAECSYYREVQEIWLRRAKSVSIRAVSVPPGQ